MATVLESTTDASRLFLCFWLIWDPPFRISIPPWRIRFAFQEERKNACSKCISIEAHVETTNWLSCVSRDRICDSNRRSEFPLCKLFQLSFKACFSIILYISHRISASARYRGTVSLKLPAFIPSTSTFTFSHRQINSPSTIRKRWVQLIVKKTSHPSLTLGECATELPAFWQGPNPVSFELQRRSDPGRWPGTAIPPGLQLRFSWSSH